ncbi:MATE family efflux transporter [Segetibacter sp. 3557_3]|uniref:MATE family efflux transporter n=1 Tax=Segetibacter sp. 3557_3 TaxID=2547429 RepID=UPI0010591E75|nr:MATE family efflux transporter [Segetibacter sp. 3557_3]TDH18328.1 MATE family efflux transporter [Segetibacter sp. 3557_3]
MSQNSNARSFSSIFQFVRQAIKGGEQDFTQGSIRRAVFLLAIPMILEMCMESVFAVVDIFFVGKLGREAAATVGLTESILTLIYSIAIGLSMAATALVARRVGEKNSEEAAKAGVQSILVALAVTVLISIAGVVFARPILRFMAAPEGVLAIGVPYMRIMFGGSVVIMLLFLINGIFRGAGDASIAMRSLWLANICNIILCPLLIYGLGPVPAFGLTGAAIATTIGRGTGVCYQLYHLFKGNGALTIRKEHFIPDPAIIRSIIKVSSTATVQFIIASASWIFLARIISSFGSDAIAGYTIALRVIVFFILPAWGLSNAAATLVGQNLGAKLPDRAEKSVWKTAQYNIIFMVFVTIVFYLFAEPIIGIFTRQINVAAIAIQALRVVSIGYVGYGLGMVLMNAFNGAGDTRTPTWINLFGFWAFQIPLAYFLAKQIDLGPKGVFWAIVIAECSITVVTLYLFRRGTWKTVKI